MEDIPVIIRSSSKIEAKQSRRQGILERKLLTADDTKFQNVILTETEQGAEVELHEISTSESIFILSGSYEVVLEIGSHPLNTGDLVFFHPQSSHGLRCVHGPGSYLVIFAPSSETTIDKEWFTY
jgi:quercetin dioxygenase-like cupin family protein